MWSIRSCAVLLINVKCASTSVCMQCWRFRDYLSRPSEILLLIQVKLIGHCFVLFFSVCVCVLEIMKELNLYIGVPFWSRKRNVNNCSNYAFFCTLLLRCFGTFVFLAKIKLRHEKNNQASVLFLLPEMFVCIMASNKWIGKHPVTWQENKIYKYSKIIEE